MQQGDVYGQEPPRWLSGCVLVPVVLLALLMGLATIALAGAFVVGVEKGPFTGNVGMGLFSVLLSALLTAFFASVARRLIAAARGREVPHLFPPVVGVAVGGLLGLACVAVAVGALFGQGRGGSAGRALGVGIVFLVYAWRQARALVRARAAAASAPSASPEG